MMIKILLGAACVVIIIFLIRFLPNLGLFFTMLKHGKRSSKYIKKFKKRFNVSPFPYCMKEDIIFKFLMFYNNDKKAGKYDTGKNIQFGETSFFSEYSEFIKGKKNPICFNAEMMGESQEVKALGYTKQVFNTSLKALFYFLDDTFFMGEYILKDLEPDKKNTIQKILKDNYELDETPTGSRFYISNTLNRKIYYFDNGFSVSIKYISLENEKINKVLFEYYDNYFS